MVGGRGEREGSEVTPGTSLALQVGSSLFRRHRLNRKTGPFLSTDGEQRRGLVLAARKGMEEMGWHSRQRF